VIEVRGVHKSLGGRPVLHGIGFAVGAGEAVGLVGPNGAGKTTTLRIVTGYLDADRGGVTIDGHAIDRERLAAQARIGYLPESAPLWADMRVVELLAFRARLKGVARGAVAGCVADAVERTALGEVRRRRVGELSKGFRQRVGLADALVARPPVLILDEPTAGLDPVQVRELRGLLRALAADHTVLLSSHALAEVEAIAARVVVIAAGRVVADGDPARLHEQAGLPAGTPFEDVFLALAKGKGSA
jgi:ABC-2 type transport system ATP-binding protein